MIFLISGGRHGVPRMNKTYKLSANEDKKIN